MCNCENEKHPGIRCGHPKCRCHRKNDTKFPLRAMLLPRSEKPDSGVPDETLVHEIRQVLNRNSAEQDSSTADYILAEFLVETLNNFNKTMQQRAAHRNEPLTFEPRKIPEDVAFIEEARRLALNLYVFTPSKISKFDLVLVSYSEVLQNRVCVFRFQPQEKSIFSECEFKVTYNGDVDEFYFEMLEVYHLN